MFQEMVRPVGFGWTIRSMAFVMLGALILPIVCVKMRCRPCTVRRAFSGSAWKEFSYAIYAVAMFVTYAGMYIPYFYIQMYCSDKGIVTGKLNLYILPIMNAVGIIGRPVSAPPHFFLPLFIKLFLMLRKALGHLADRIGPLNAYIFSCWSSAIICGAWLVAESQGSVLTFAVLYGFFSSGLVSLPATVVTAVLSPDEREFGVRLSMQEIPAAIGLLIGNPIAGALLAQGWRVLIVFATCTLGAGTVLSIATREAKVGWHIKHRC